MERKLAYVALFAALIAILTLVPAVTLPSGVPITAQTLGVILAGTVLGSRLGFAAVALYVALGVIGLPILSGGTGGFGVLAGPTGGFLIGFPFAAFVAGLVVEKWRVQIGVAAFVGWRCRDLDPMAHVRSVGVAAAVAAMLLLGGVLGALRAIRGIVAGRAAAKAGR